MKKIDGKKIDGKMVARLKEAEIKSRLSKIAEKNNFKPKMVTIIIGDHGPSLTYVRMKDRKASSIGFDSEILKLDKTTKTNQLIDFINSLNNDNKVCGILIQHPLPEHIDEDKAFDSISCYKDIDGLNSKTIGENFLNYKTKFTSATVKGIISLLQFYDIPLKGKNVVIIGRSRILGKQLLSSFLNLDSTVQICHSKTVNLKEKTKNADIVISAVGINELITHDMLKKGVVVIDAGYQNNKGDLKLCKKTLKKVSLYTPVPGGVGPMTIASLLEQAVEAASKLYHSDI